MIILFCIQIFIAALTLYKITVFRNQTRICTITPSTVSIRIHTSSMQASEKLIKKCHLMFYGSSAL